MNMGIVDSKSQGQLHREDSMRITWQELAILSLVVVIAALVAIAIAFVFDGLRPAKLLIDQGNGQIIEVDE